MTFSSAAKMEICKQDIHASCCTRSEMYGVLLYGHSFSAREIRVVTENSAFGTRLELLLSKAFGFTFDQFPLNDDMGKRVYLLTSAEKIRAIAQVIGYDEGATIAHQINFSLIEQACC